MSGHLMFTLHKVTSRRLRYVSIRYYETKFTGSCLYKTRTWCAKNRLCIVDIPVNISLPDFPIFCILIYIGTKGT